MSGGSLLVGAALALVAAAFVARPFRPPRGDDLERNIARWVADVRALRPAASPRFCRQCGRALGEGDRFCATCGTPVKEQDS